MTEKKGFSFYRALVYAAYGFYILMGLTWFITSFLGSGHFNLQAFMLIVVFSVQAYYKNALTDLILGILSLGLSIFMVLQEIGNENLFAKDVVADDLTKVLIGFAFFSMAMSLILMFSYPKFGMKSKQ